MSPAARGGLQGILALFDAKSVRVGLCIAGISLGVMLIWVSLSRPPICGLVDQASGIAQQYPWLAYAILTAWSFCLFLTILPLGTMTIFIAGFFLGPLAGVAQFGALLISSMILFQLSKDKTDAQLRERLSAWPALEKWSDFACRFGLVFSGILRIIPIVPSAAAALCAAYFHISRKDFLIGTFITGWIRPVGFATLGALGKFTPICGLNV